MVKIMRGVRPTPLTGREPGLSTSGHLDPIDRVYPDVLARSQFSLARALWLEPGKRDEARSLAEQARDTFIELGRVHHSDLAAVEAWLEEHRLD